MAKRILMKFKKGGEITATLLEDKAPKTCEAFWAALPVERSVLHAMLAGEEIFFMQYPTTAEIGPENQTSDVKPGDVGFDAVTGWKSFCIFYGKAKPRSDIDTIVDINIFAKVDDIEKMVEIGKRIRVNGTEKIRISRL